MAEWIRRGSGGAEIPEPSVILDCRGGGELEYKDEKQEGRETFMFDIFLRKLYESFFQKHY